MNELESEEVNMKSEREFWVTRCGKLPANYSLKLKTKSNIMNSPALSGTSFY
jgi:hypothetical protein